MTRRAALAGGLACLALAASAPGQDGGEKPRFFFERGNAPAAPMEAARAADPAQLGQALFDFEQVEDLAGWIVSDPEAVIDLATEEGGSCLRVTYVAREGAFEQLSAQALTVTEGAALAFRVKSDLPTNLSFGVVERDGAFYQQFAALPAGEWTRVSVPLASLILSQDTQDPSGRLEPGNIVEVRLADLANLPGGLGDALGRKTGVQYLCLDDVAILPEAEPVTAGAGDPRLFVDGFEGEAVHALAIGNARLSRTPEGEGHALGVLCADRAVRWAGFVMGVGHLSVTAAQALTLRARAAEPLLLNVTLEERDGSKYSRRVALEAGETWTEMDLPLETLVLETDSEDENGQLDRGQVRVLVIVADTAHAARFPASFSLDDVTFR